MQSVERVKDGVVEKYAEIKRFVELMRQTNDAGVLAPAVEEEATTRRSRLWGSGWKDGRRRRAAEDFQRVKRRKTRRRRRKSGERGE